MSIKTENIGRLCAVASGTLWGLSAVCAQSLFKYRGFNARWLVDLRLLCSGAVLLMLALSKQNERKGLSSIISSRKDLMNILLFAFLGCAMTQLGYYTTVEYANAGTATVLQYMAPAFIMIYTLITNARLPKGHELLALILVMAGVFFLATHGDPGNLVLSPAALTWGVLSAIAYASYSIIPRRLLKIYHLYLVVGLGMFLGGIILLPYSRPWEVTGQVDGMAALGILFVIVLGTLVPFTIYFFGVDRIGPVRASLYACVEPVVSVVCTMLVLSVPMYGADILGLICVLTGVVILTVK